MKHISWQNVHLNLNGKKTLGSSNLVVSNYSLLHNLISDIETIFNESIKLSFCSNVLRISTSPGRIHYTKPTS